MIRHALPVLMLALLPLAALEAQENQAPQKLESHEQKFAELLTGAKLIGHYTTWGNEDKPKRDTYTLEKVSKAPGDNNIWIFLARIQYGEHDVKLPLPLPVKWAGETPVIALDKFPVPGFGAFSVRLVFHDKYYAGTWDGGDHGGHMYGTIERASAAEEKPASGEEKPKPSSEKDKP